MQPKIKILIILKIIEIIPNGFIGYDIQTKTHSTIKIVDKKIPNIFFKNDIVDVSIQYTTEPKEEIINNELTLCMVVGNIMPRGFYTLEYQKEKNIFKNILFKNERGYIVLPELESRNIFEIGDIILLSIKLIKR